VVEIAEPRERIERRTRLSSHADEGLRRARELAEDRGDALVTPAHVLLGLLARRRSTASLLLDHFEVGAARLSEHLVQLLPPRRRTSRSRMPEPSRAVLAALNLARQEASAAGEPNVGSGHVLLGLLRDGDGLVALTLREYGLTEEGLRTAMRRRLE
jgi:ATP-dependent Clp protease ATP-binding subunit ClpB